MGHLRGTSLLAQKNRSYSEHLIHSGRKLTRHLVYDRTPLMFNGGVRGQDANVGSVHLPHTVGFFFVGLGLTAAGLARRRVDRAILFLLIAGMLPGLLAVGVRPRRLIIMEPAYFLLAGRGLAAVVVSAVALCKGRSRLVAYGAAGAAGMAMLCVGWGTYMEMCRKAEPAFNRMLAEELVGAIDDEMIVSLFNEPTIRKTVELLSWPGSLRLRERWRVSSELEDLTPAPGVSRARFVFRGDRTRFSDFDETFARYAEKHEQWVASELTPRSRRKRFHYFWVSVPIADLPVAKDFVGSLAGSSRPVR
jgi:hypothetical protein